MESLELASVVELAIQNKEWIALFGTLVVGALTARQRLAIITRDKEYGIKINKGGCQWPEEHADCNGNLEVDVHHVVPQHYSQRMGIDPDFDENAITLCTNRHRKAPDSVHPDVFSALNEYREGNKEAFKDMARDRQELLKNKHKYWDDTHDHQFHVLAVRNTQRAKKEGWVWPQHKKRGE